MPISNTIVMVIALTEFCLSSINTYVVSVVTTRKVE
ncbi:hypothetical protein MGSAQ_000792 [marine sediment metagenome]|uniref:Uncharacterized protein n=1 Tax=marine sediment metagenome TaxID=412755 RepID=A0A1B6NXJ4_9ZZZZ